MSNRWTMEDVNKLDARKVKGLEAKPSKYRNKKTEVQGVEFDSKKEAARWIELLNMQRAGEITHLRRQVTYGLTVNGELVCTYKADFSYCNSKGEKIIEDCKGMKTDVYIIKKKLMLAVHGIEIKET